jgi:GNAT superfamily N-acetyltransferase
MREQIVYREILEADLPAITVVRTSVRENHRSVDELAALGITKASVAASLKGDSKGWVALDGEAIVGFVIADNSISCIFALFVLPGYESRGIGSALLCFAVEWMWDNGHELIWLETRQGTRAETFYRRKGWRAERTNKNGLMYFERART